MIRNALIIGSSGGIGKGLYNEFINLGYNVIGLSRSVNGLDITNENSIKENLKSLQKYKFDRIIIASGSLEINNVRPEKSIKELNKDNMINHFMTNSIGPMLCIKNCIKLVPRDKCSVIGVLSARVGSIGDNRLGGWHSYRMSKASLNQGIRGASIQLARTHPLATLIALHPGTIETKLTKNYSSRYNTMTPEVCASNLINVMDNLDTINSGCFYDYNGKEIVW
jgi:NAD(P)-dependent dehydrogenase (short-subunit alcohol dehydrogenase family)